MATGQILLGGSSFWARRKPWLAALVLFVACALSGYLSLVLAEVAGASSPVWLANGIAIAGLVLGGVRLWPSILLARIAAGWLAGSTQPLEVELLIAAAQTLAAVLPALLLGALRVSERLDTFHDMLAYMFVAGVIGAGISTLLGTMALGMLGDTLSFQQWELVYFWFCGTLAGTLITGPLVQSWWNNWRLDNAVHGVVLFTFLTVLALLLLVVFEAPSVRIWHFLPFLIWAAVAFQVRGASLALFLLMMITLLGIEWGKQPFLITNNDAIETAILLQQLIVIAGVSALLLGAIDQERRDKGEQALRLALDAADMGTFLHRHGSQSLKLDAVARERFGGDLPDGSVEFAQLQERVHPDDKWKLEPLMAADGEVSSKGGFATTLRITTAEGDTRWLTIHGHTRSGAGGTAGEGTTRGTVQDVTAQKASEKAAASSAAFVGEVLDSLFAFVGVLDRDGTVLQTNRAPLDMADLKPEDVNGKKFWDCYWWNFSDESREWIRDACRRVADGEIIRKDVPVRAAGGATLWIDFQMAPLRNDEGEITHLIPSGMDISERQMAESENRRLLTMVQHAANFIGMTDADMNTIFLNEGGRRMLGLTAEDMSWTGKHITTFHPEFESDILHRDIMSALDELGLWEGETRLVTPEGLMPVTQSISRYTDEDTGEVFHSLVMQDISELKDAQQRQALLLKELAHRVKNMLTVIQSIARQTIRQTNDPGEFVRSFSGRIDALALSHGQLSEGDWRDLELESVMRDQIDALTGAVDKRTTLAGPKVLLAPESASKLSLAAHELATNAIKHGGLSTPNGTIEITWSIDEQQRVSIHWTEKGLPHTSEIAKPMSSGFGTTLLQSTYPDLTRKRDGDTFAVAFTFDPQWGRTGTSSIH